MDKILPPRRLLGGSVTYRFQFAQSPRVGVASAQPPFVVINQSTIQGTHVKDLVYGVDAHSGEAFLVPPLTG